MADSVPEVSLQEKFDRLFDCAKRYVECDMAQVRGEHFRDLAGTIQWLEGEPDAVGWPQCYRRLELGMVWVIKALRMHSSRPAIEAICDQAQRCLRGLWIPTEGASDGSDIDTERAGRGPEGERQPG